ncbi:MAG: ATP-binding protein [Spirochaetales bacterium]
MQARLSLIRYLRRAFVLFIAFTILGILLLGSLQPPLIWGLALLGAWGILLNGILLFLFYRKWERPLNKILRVAERYAQGDLEPKLAIEDPLELGILGDTLSWMATELKTRIDTIALQRNELEGILKGMSEAVLLLDEEGRIKRMNHAAESLAGSNGRECKGKPLFEVIPSKDLERFVRTIRTSEGMEEQTLVFSSEGKKRYLQVHGRLLPMVKKEEPNLLLVLNDVTRIKQLEEMRKDFVANVSHELRTPITSILGFVETLKEGALQDPVQAERFLSIIENQTLRLHSLIEDLLGLSRLEQSKTSIRKEWTTLSEIFQETQTLSQLKAEKKGILLCFHIREGTSKTIYVHPSLIVQALGNLVDNAIQYSDPGTEVKVTAFTSEGIVCMEVRDTGPGIPEGEQERIFERFYRIDKTRSRALGGTGLGLAIVKHIAQAHGGTVSLESSPGEGSTFTLRIPQPSSMEIP